MKKRIKVTKQLLKEDDTEKRSIKRDKTQRAARGSRGEEYMTPSEKEGKYGPLKGDPTNKVSRQELEAALAGAPVEKGIMQKVKDYLYNNLFSRLEPTEKVEMDSDIEVPGGGKFSPIPGPSASPEQQQMAQQATSQISPLGNRDSIAKKYGIDPDSLDDQNDPDYLKQFRKLQEIADRHFKKRK